MLPSRIKRNSGRARAQRSFPGHLAWVRGHACSVPGCQNMPIEAAHVRTGTDGGMGLKPRDTWVISLCRDHHARQHQIGEASFEAETSIDMAKLAREFAARSPHRQKWAGL